MRGQNQIQRKNMQTINHLICILCCAMVLVLLIHTTNFNGSGVIDHSNRLVIDILSQFQTDVQQCVSNRGLGLTAQIVDHCKLILKYPEGTNSTWYNEQFKKKEPLEYPFDVCEAVLLWEQYRNVSTVLTREYLDVRPDGWLDYAAKRIAQLGTDKCYNQSLCDELLSPILPAKPPFHPRQFERCAVVGNSGDLLLTEFGEEIDSHDAVIRDNEAPVNEILYLRWKVNYGHGLGSRLPMFFWFAKFFVWFTYNVSLSCLDQLWHLKYAKYVGMRRTFRLGVRGTARSMAKILKGAPEEVFIIKSVTHRDFNEMIKIIANPVYLFQGIVLRRGAKGTGMKSIELALSMCDIVDIYGFTVDPGYKEWTRYFSEPRKGHNPLQGRAYYQLLECLGVIRIHSPLRAKREEDWSNIPSRDTIHRAHAAAVRLKQSETGRTGDMGQFRNCKFWGTKNADYNSPVSGSPDLSDVRKNSNYSKWESMPFDSLRKEAQEYYKQMEGVSMYKMDGNKLDDLVCVRHPLESQV